MENPALEEQRWNTAQLAHTVEQAQFRIWTYDAPAIVLGCAQAARRDEIAARVDRRMACVAREAGGGAVLTGPWMVSASVALPLQHPWVQPSVTETYVPLAKLHLAALSACGVSVCALAPGDVAAARAANDVGVADWACFGGLSAWEIVNTEGRKLIGLAQRRRRSGVLLVAGTLVSPPQWGLLCDAMDHAEHVAVLRRCTVSMEEILGGRVDAVHYAQALQNELARGL